MEVVVLPGMSGMDGPGLRSVQKSRQDDSFVHLQPNVQMEVLAAPFGVLQPAEELAGFRNPLTGSEDHVGGSALAFRGKCLFEMPIETVEEDTTEDISGDIV
ncbi:hypothetical protein SprV_0100287900 [Sparganum proliferum]